MSAQNKENTHTRRDLLYLTTAAVGGVGVATAIWPFVHSMNPARDTLAVAETEVNIAQVEVGQSIRVIWQGKPIFIRRRTADEIKKARNIDVATLRHKEADEDRVQKDEWLVMVGVCTHLGCVPLGTRPNEPKGEYEGWFCPCHGSHYDTSGRIRKGPAPTNLDVPPYEFISDDVIRIG